jgi:hypothetical protein
MLLYFDLDRGRLVSSPGVSDSQPALTLKRGDTLPVILRFTRGLVVQELASGATGIIGIKPVGDYDGPYLAAAIGWTKDGTGTATTYTFVLDLGTVEINEAMGIGEAEDIPSLPVNFELEFVQSGNTTSSQTILSTLQNDVIRGDEESPENAPSIALLRDGSVQTLTTEQKAQVLANLGISAPASKTTRQITESGTTITLTPENAGNDTLILATNAGAISAVFTEDTHDPDNALTWFLLQAGAGVATVTAADAETISGDPSTAGQNTAICIMQVAADEVIVIGGAA